MGAWDVDTFDNDTACDWAGELDATSDLSIVREAFNAVIEAGNDYLDSDEASTALAACEVLARLKGQWGKRDAYTETVDRWVTAHPQTPPPDLIKMALSTIDRIRTEPSELLELWEEDDASPWHAAVEDLRQRVERSLAES
jgi:hypothetical protein